MKFDTPILFLIFNRPESTRQVFEVICKIKPTKLFVAADGPRLDKEDEKEKCEAVRKIVTQIDWDCELTTLFREENLACGKAVSESITWFFDHVEEGIILEDDCLPDLSFFKFCEELLERYRDNNRIMIISGTNQIGNNNTISDSYTFTATAGIWGWASWRRAWNTYNFNIPDWQNQQIKQQVFDSFYFQDEAKVFIDGVDAVATKQLDTWDYQWALSRLLHDGLGIVPKYNLITNLGFGSDSTHTFDPNHVSANLPTKSVTFPLSHPAIVLQNQSYNMALNNFYKPKPQIKHTIKYRVTKKIAMVIEKFFK